MRQVLRFSLAAALAAAANWVWAQEVRATIGGKVTDPQGALVPNAQVIVMSDDSGVTRQTSTNAQGNWLMEFLLPGRYHFTISASGFKTESREGIKLQTADNKQFDVRLQVGESSQEVQVTGEAPLIDTTSATSGTVITHEEIMELPSASHVVTLLATLSPGVVAQDQNNNVVHLWSYNGASQFTADGGRNNVFSNNFQLDGAPDVKSGGDIAFVPAMDSVEEFRVSTNAYDAAIGRQAGATVNLQTRAGGKDYHGTLYEFNQNSILNANLFQTNLIGGAVAPVHFNEFGGTFGGPVWIPKVYKGTAKTFFFVSYDKTLNSNPLGDSTRSVPDAAERAGDFSQSFTTQNVNGQLQRFPIMIYDPASVNPATGNRTPFPNNVIPQNRLSPIAQNILKYVPLPNTTAAPTGNDDQNYVPPAVRNDTFPEISIRGDQNWSNSQRTFATVRYHHLTELTNDDFGPADIASGTYNVRINKSASLDHVWTLSPTKILNLRTSVTRYEEPNHDAGAGFDPSKLGFGSNFTSLQSIPSFPYINGIAGNFGTNQASNLTDTTYYTWAASFTQVHGNHTFGYGAEYWVLQQGNRNVGNQGEFDFNNSNWTRQNNLVSGGTGVGSQLASFLLGLPNGGNMPNNAQAFYSQHYAGFYFKDDWRVSPKLTINLGMRWDFEREPVERFNRLTDRYDPTAVNPITPAAQAAYAAILANPATVAANPGLAYLQQYLPASQFQVLGSVLFAGVNGTPRTSINNDLREWQPRAGFAYQIGPHTVIRGGFGRFTQADYITGGQNGFSRTTSLIATNDNYITPYGTLANPFPTGLLTPTGSSLGALTNPGTSPNWDNPNLGRPYSWEYSLHVQQEWKGWLFEVGYSHNKTYNLAVQWYENEESFALWKQLQTPTFDANGKPPAQLPWNLQVPNPFYGLAPLAGTPIGTNKTIAVSQMLSPNAMYSSSGISENNPSGKNQYDAGLGKIERRFKNGFSIIASFTWSKLFEDTSFVGPQIAGYHIEHKLGGEDRPFHFNVAPIWDIPVGRKQRYGANMSRWADAIVGGWELSGNFNIQSGVPVVFSNAAFFSGKDFALPHSKQSLNEWFDTTQFLPFPNANTPLSTIQSYPAWTGIQNMPGYNYVPQPGDTIKNGVYQDFANFVQTYPTRWNDVRASRVNEVNIGLYKSFMFTERVKFQLRFDAFNAFNHPRFAAPDTNPSDSTFGRVTPSQQNQARSIELGARLSF
jgi:hypothetical protein